MITGAQIRMARAALHWTVAQLADKAELNWARAQVLERTDGIPTVSEDTLAKIRLVFEQSGIVFIDGDPQIGPGVRLRSPFVS